MSSGKTILITGCSANGIGAALTQALASGGHHIFATARDVSKIPESLASLPNVTTLALDVTSAPSVLAAAEAVRTATTDMGRTGLDVLVNNAGVGYAMPLLDADLDEARRLFETNVWGMMRTVQAFSALLIESHGLIVNVSSVGGVLHTPWIGIYSSSKAATTTLSETLRLELAPFGVSVVTLMVGTVSTSFHANTNNVSRFALPPSSRYSLIEETIQRWAAGEAGPKRGSLSAFAESVAEVVLSRSKSGQIWKGPNASLVRWVTWLLPTWLVDYLTSNGQGLDELSKDYRKRQ